MPATPNIIDQLGTSWKLTVQEFATYSYQHPTFGYLEYTGRTAWLCDNVNTVWLTSQGSLPDGVLPPSICIRPSYSSPCGCYDLNTYDPPEAKCLCKDPECPFDLELWLTCGGVTQSAMTTFTATDGASSECTAAGPVYVGTATLNSVVMDVHIYCDGSGQWYADVFNDDVLCDSCIPLTPTFCPLVMGGGTVEPCDNNCVPCIGPECVAEPPPTVVCDICSTLPPNTLTCTLSTLDCPTLDGDSFTITYQTGLPDISGNTEGWVGEDTCGNTWRFWCGGTWPDFSGFTYNEPGTGIPGGTSASGSISEADCSPFEATCTAAANASSTPCCGDGVGITATITE